MKMRISVFSIALFTIMAVYSANNAEAASRTEVSTFNGEVSVTILKDGKPTEERVILKPGAAVVSKKTLDEISLIKQSVTWRDVGEYEQAIVARDPYSRLYIDNIWAKRINWALGVIEVKTGYCPPLKVILNVLGIPRQRPSGKGVYVLVPGGDNGKPSKGSRVTYLDENLNEYLDAANKVATSPAIVIAAQSDIKKSGAD